MSVVPQIQASWAATGGDAGGFRHLREWDGPVSLYATAWNLCLRDTYRIHTAGLDVPATAAHLRAAPAGDADRSLPPLERAWLVSRGLGWLHEALPAAQLREVLRASRSGDLYAFLPEEKPTWAAAQRAVEIEAALGDSPSPQLEVRLRAELGPATANATSETFVTSVLPLWTLADRMLPADERQRFRPSLVNVLQSQFASIGRNPAGSAVSVLVTMYQVAAANQIDVPPAERLSLAALVTPQGYLSLFSDRASPDPQVTCRAAALGQALLPSLAETVARTARPDGWQQWPSNPPDPMSSLFALLSLRGLGQSWNESQLRVQTARWLEQAGAIADCSARGSLPNLGAVLALGRELGLSPPVATVELVRRLIATCEPGAEAWLMAVAPLVGLDVPRDSPLRARIAEHPPRSMTEAWAAALAARTADGPGSSEAARFAAGQLQTATLAFRRSDQFKEPDLQSTAAGLQLVTAGRGVRGRAVARFGSSPRFWLWPVGTGPGNVCDPLTLYLGLLASGTITDTTGLDLLMSG